MCVVNSKKATLPIEPQKLGSRQRLFVLEKVAKLASELCESFDRAELDIGGSRTPMTILQEIGPLCDKLEGR